MGNTDVNTHILFADDAQTNRTLIEIILKRAGYTVASCVNGQEAIEYAEKQKFDVILMDIQMPVMDGIEATKRIKAGTMNKNTPIIALTASDTKEDTMMCLSVGFDDHLAKSSKHEQIIHKVGRFIKQTEAIKKSLADGEIVSLLADEYEYHKTIEMFLHDLPVRIKEIREAFENGNLQELARKIHSLKGLGGFAGFPIYTEKAKELEELLHSNKLDDIKRQLDELNELCQRTKLCGSGSTQRPA